MIAVAEQDYQTIQDRLHEAVASARLLGQARSGEVEVCAVVYATMPRAMPRAVAVLAAAAITRLARTTDHGLDW